LEWDDAKRLVQAVEDAFGAADLTRIEQGFTEDAVTRFADFPEMRGDASWEDAQTGKQMLGRGTEIWLVRDGRIALWDATFNAWEKGGKPMTPLL
jgi:ketosteroid isomerase-like protein